jgi:spore germination protein
MKKIYMFIIVLVVMIFLTGCWDQNIYEKIGFILNTGIDLGSDDKVLITQSYPIISETAGNSGGGGPDESEGIKVETIRAKSNLLRESREIFRLSTSLKLEGGKLQSILIGSDFARERNISEYFELYERDIQSTVQASVVVVDGNASELITKGARFKGKPRLGIYINEVLKRNFMAGYCPDTDIIEYDIINTTPGISPIVPMIKLEGNNIKVTGTALIDRDKMTGQLDTGETACLYLAMGRTKQSEIIFDLPEDIQSEKKKGAVFTRKVITKSKIKFQDNAPTIHFDIKPKVILDEYTWGDITDPEYQNKLEESLNTHIEKCLDNTFKKLQAAKCDAFGIGDKIRAYHYDYWMSIGELDGWKKIYVKMTATFDVKSQIVRYGEIK